MQVRAIFEAASMVAKEGVALHPEIMIPLTSHVNELRAQREILEEEAKKVMREQGITVDDKFGTMIEVPRAALTADQLAEHAEFFSFGTNDLTQTTFGMSRDDAETGYLIKYLRAGKNRSGNHGYPRPQGHGQSHLRLGGGARRQNRPCAGDGGQSLQDGLMQHKG